MHDSKSNIYEKVTGMIVSALCVGFSLALIFLPKSDWSENENRKLAEWPALTTDEIVHSDFLSDMENYLADHFPMRDLLVSVNTQFNEFLGRREINQVFICGNGFLIDKYKTPLRTEAILKAFNRVPDQMQTMRYLYEGFDGDTVDVTPALRSHRDEYQLYYRTDHHWTTYGAYYAYVELCEKWEMAPVAMDAFDIRQVTGDFRGTTYSKVNDLTVKGEPMYRFSLAEQSPEVQYGTGEKALPGMLYNEDYLTRKDKYSYFLDNIHDLMVIRNPDALTDRKLVVIKDSYANCFIPFLTAHFSEITVVDLRYYHTSVLDLISDDDSVTDVLILYNLGTMDQDTGVTVIF